MMFLLGRHAMLGQEPPTYFRSMTAVFIPFLASVQESSLPAAPLPRISSSYSSTSADRPEPPAVLVFSDCVVFIVFRCWVVGPVFYGYRSEASHERDHASTIHPELYSFHRKKPRSITPNDK